MNDTTIELVKQSDFDIEACEPLVCNSLPVVPTQLLAQLYGCDNSNIKMNSNRNQQRFDEDKRFFKVEGDDLRELKHLVTDCYRVEIPTQAPSLMLWTERGAARHAKMLETDSAWDVFERLEDAYFNRDAATVRVSAELLEAEVATYFQIPSLEMLPHANFEMAMSYVW